MSEQTALVAAVLAVPREEWAALPEGKSLRLPQPNGYFNVPRTTGLRIHDKQKKG